SRARRRRTRSSTAAPPRRSRWCSTTPDVALVTAGDPARRTGGNLYNRHMLAALRKSGIRVTTIVLRNRRDAARLRELRAPLVVVDTIAASLALPYLALVRNRGSEVVALAHMALGAMTLARRADRVIAVSHALADELVAGGIGRRRIVVIPPGRDRVRPRTNAKRRGAILSVANWTPGKGIHTLVAAVARVPDVSLDPAVGSRGDRWRARDGYRRGQRAQGDSFVWSDRGRCRARPYCCWPHHQRRTDGRSRHACPALDVAGIQRRLSSFERDTSVRGDKRSCPWAARRVKFLSTLSSDNLLGSTSALGGQAWPRTRSFEQRNLRS